MNQSETEYLKEQIKICDEYLSSLGGKEISQGIFISKLRQKRKGYKLALEVFNLSNEQWVAKYGRYPL